MSADGEIVLAFERTEVSLLFARECVKLAETFHISERA